MQMIGDASWNGGRHEAWRMAMAVYFHLRDGGCHHCCSLMAVSKATAEALMHYQVLPPAAHSPYQTPHETQSKIPPKSDPNTTCSKHISNTWHSPLLVPWHRCPQKRDHNLRLGVKEVGGSACKLTSSPAGLIVNILKTDYLGSVDFIIG